MFDRSDLVIVRKDIPARQIKAGQPGTVVDLLAEDVALVDFADGHGYSTGVAPVPVRWLRHYHGFTKKKKDLIANRVGILRKAGLSAEALPDF
jgi:hypothetical protein